jgi:FolB domain-containing protein
VSAPIGLDCWHREKPQPALITVRVPKSIEEAGRTDKIADTLDYRPIYKAVTELQSAKHYHDLPEFAKEICNRVSQVTSSLNLEVVVLLPKAIRQADGIQIETRMQSTQGFGSTPAIHSSIFIVKGLKVDCVIGVGEAERREKQPVVLDLELRGSPAGFNHRDYQAWFGGILIKVGGSLDHERNDADVEQKFEPTSYSTIEMFATEVAKFLILNQQWTEVSVSARKSSIFGAAEGPGVEILRDSNFEWE